VPERAGFHCGLMIFLRQTQPGAPTHKTGHSKACVLYLADVEQLVEVPRLVRIVVDHEFLCSIDKAMMQENRLTHSSKRWVSVGPESGS
jgi:hypothetical protein